MIHLVDKKVEEERIIQHHQAHPDTVLPTASLRESLIVGMYTMYVCVGVSPLGSSFVSIVELIWDGVSPLWSSLGSRALFIMRACFETASDPRTF